MDNHEMTTMPQNARPKPSEPLHEALEKLFEEYGVELAIAAFQLPEANDPGVLYIGHFYEAACLSALVSRRLKERIKDDLAD